jgi:hypothetical protein
MDSQLPKQKTGERGSDAKQLGMARSDIKILLKSSKKQPSYRPCENPLPEEDQTHSITQTDPDEKKCLSQ